MSFLSRYDTSHFTCRVGISLEYVHRSASDRDQTAALRASSGIISWSTPLLCLGAIACRRCPTASYTRREYRGSLPTVLPGNPPRSIDFVRRRTLYLRPTYRHLFCHATSIQSGVNTKGAGIPELDCTLPRGKERPAEKNPFDTLTPAMNRSHRLLDNYTDDNNISTTAAMRIS